MRWKMAWKINTHINWFMQRKGKRILIKIDRRPYTVAICNRISIEKDSDKCVCVCECVFGWQQSFISISWNYKYTVSCSEANVYTHTHTNVLSSPDISSTAKFFSAWYNVGATTNAAGALTHLHSTKIEVVLQVFQTIYTQTHRYIHTILKSMIEFWWWYIRRLDQKFCVCVCVFSEPLCYYYTIIAF